MTVMAKTSNRLFFGRALIVLTLVGVLATMGLWWWNKFGQHQVWQEAFDATAWKQAAPLGSAGVNRWRTVRSSMIEDVLRRYDFDGWTRQEVIDVLGEPAPGVKGTGFEQWDMIYVLGLERGGAFALDDEALGFRLDTADRVTKYGLSVN